MITRLRAVGSAMALLLLVPIAASAQAPGNPFAELFGRAKERSGREFTAVQFRSTVGAQMGQTLEEQFQAPDTVIPDGMSGGADGALVGDYIRDRVQIAGQGRYSYQEYRKVPAFGAPAFDAGLRANIDATTRLSFQGGAHFTRSPFFRLLWLAPDPIAAVPVDRSAILLMRNDTTEGSAGFTSQYTKRSSLNFSGQTRQTRFVQSPERNFSSIGGRGQWKRQMSRDLAVRAGYGREELRQKIDGVDTTFRNELLDIGIDFSRAISVARRTSLSFGTETSLLSENGGARHFRLNGSVLLERRFQRSWQAQLSARRATEFLPGFRAPVFTEHGHFALAGYLAKRLMLNINGDGGQGEVGFNDPRKFISYGGDAKLTLAATRHLGVFTQYVYYHYQMPADPLALFVMPQGARQAVSVGVQTWISIVDKEKVTRDPR